MKRLNYRLVTILLFTLLASCAIAGEPESLEAELQRLRQEILNLKHKIERLEKSRAPLRRELEKAREARQAEEAGRPLPQPSPPTWKKRLEFSGLVEIEASTTDAGGGESDLQVSTVELGADAQINPWMNAHLLVLYEQGKSDPPEIDEAIITIANLERSPWSLAVGRQYVPFGNYDSHMVSDPLTLEIGETRAAAAQAGFVRSDFHALAFAFRGDTDSEIHSFGLNLGLSHAAEGDAPGYNLEISWLNNLAESKSLRELISRPGRLEKRVPGLAFQGSLIWKKWKFIAEWLGAATAFDPLDLTFDGQGAKPQAGNLEAGYRFQLARQDSFAALGWQFSRQATALGLPRQRYLATLGVELFEDVTLAAEYARDQDYQASKGGNGERCNTFTLQLAAVF